MELYNRTNSNLRFRLLSPRLLADIKVTNADWRGLKSLKDWELITRNSSTPINEENCFEAEPLKPREFWEILDWILWENGNLVETACCYPLANIIWTEKPFELVLEELCLVAYSLLKEWMKKESPFLKELGQKIRIYFMKLYAIHTSGYQKDAVPPTDDAFEEWANSELNSYVRKHNLDWTLNE